MVVKLTSTPSMRLQRDGNVLESLNTHHSFGMKYVDPNLIIYIIKSAQQFLSTELQSRERERAGRQAGVIMIHSSHVSYLGHLSFPTSIISAHINCTFYQSPVVFYSFKEDLSHKSLIKLLNCYFAFCTLASEITLVAHLNVAFKSKIIIVKFTFNTYIQLQQLCIYQWKIIERFEINLNH